MMEPMLVELAFFFDAVTLVEPVDLVVGTALTTVSCSPSGREEVKRGEEERGRVGGRGIQCSGIN